MTHDELMAELLESVSYSGEVKPWENDPALDNEDDVDDAPLSLDDQPHVYRMGFCLTCRVPRLDCRDWDPDLHPRDEDGRFAGNGGGASSGGADPNEDDFKSSAMANMQATSRTSKGISDTSSSKDKQKLVVEGAALAEKSAENFRDAIDYAWRVKDKPLQSPDDVHDVVMTIGQKISAGLTRPGQSILRQHETKFKQTPVPKLEGELKTFSRELYERITGGEDPVKTAAWADKRFNGEIHPFADGVGRSTQALTAWILARGGSPLPKFPSRDDYFKNMLKSYSEWEDYYRSITPKKLSADHVYRMGWCVTCGSPQRMCLRGALSLGSDAWKDQPRDENGQWASTGAAGGGSSASDDGSMPSAELQKASQYASKYRVPVDSIMVSRDRILSEATTAAEKQWATELAVADAIAKETIKSGDTKKQYTLPDGRYTPERLKVHEQIYERFWQRHLERNGRLPQEGLDEPVVTFMAGMPGAGKSTAAADVFKGPDSWNTVKIDPDEMKEFIPEYKDGSYTQEVQRESGDLADRLLEMAVSRRMNIVIDGTMKTSGVVTDTRIGDGALGKMAAFKEFGYRVEARFVDVTVEQSIERVVKRFADDFVKKGMGRYVPTSFTRSLADSEYGTQPRRSFEMAKETSYRGRPLVDAWVHTNGWTGERVSGSGTFRVVGK